MYTTNKSITTKKIVEKNFIYYYIIAITCKWDESTHFPSFKRKIFLYDKGDYESYRNLLSVVDWDGIFRNDDIDIITNTIPNTILDAANKTIPNRYITVKKDNPPWITTKIKKVHTP